ncbi:MAG: hypothetical protein SNJ55_06380 [Chloroherpetonaceae bacterium]
MTNLFQRLLWVALAIIFIGNNAVAQDKKGSGEETIDPEKVGKIFFTQQMIGKQAPGKKITDTDGETYIEEYELGKPLYARAFYTGYDKDKGGLSIRFTIDGEVFAEEDMREFWRFSELRNQNKGMSGVSSAGTSYYAWAGTAAIPLISDKNINGRYIWLNMYSIQEEAFRMLLSRLKDKIKVGNTMTLKAEVFQTSRFANEKKDTDGPVMASGEVKVKVTEFSKDLANMLCRCGEKGMDDKKLEAEIAEAFKFGYREHCAKVYKVVVNDRDYQIVTDKRTGVVRGRYVGAGVIWETKDGDYWVAKHNFWFPFTGTGFAEKAQLDSYILNAPTAKLCIGDGKEVAQPTAAAKASEKKEEKKKEDKKKSGKDKKKKS